MILTDIINNLRLELHDTGETLYTNDELVRAINKSVSLMSRLLPRRTLVSGLLTSGAIVNDHILDISTILPECIRIERVEYPADQSPPQYPTFDIVDTYLIFRNAMSLTAGDTIRLFYLSRWEAPTSSVEGNYPSHLNDGIIIGSAGQAMIFKAEKYVQLAAESLTDDLASMDELAAIVFTTSPSITTELGLANTAMNAAIAAMVTSLSTLGSMSTPLANAATALDKVGTEVTAGKGYLTTGSALINAATRGESVGETYGQYGQVQSTLALAYEREAGQRIAIALAHEAKSGRDSTIANGYLNEALQRLTGVARILDKYAGDINTDRNKVTLYSELARKISSYEPPAKQYLEIAGRYLASGQAKINEFLASMGVKPELITQRASTEQRS